MEKLKVGIIGGGGPESFFGGVHRRAIALDATREVVAGALRSNPEAAMEAAEQWGIQGFPDYQAMIDACRNGELELDYITIATPNHAHFGPAKACVEAGIPVMCEKPMTLTLAEAEELAALVEKHDVPFVLAHTYTGHPMMMYARELIREGQIGDIRKIDSWYTQGWLAEALEKEGAKQAVWRTDPDKAGLSNCGGDIGTHAFIHATWTTGLKIKRLSARLNRFVKGRLLDDDFNVIAEMDNGATALINATQIAIGHKNDCGFLIHGTKGTLEWRQEQAEKLVVKRNEFDETYWLGANYSYFPESVASYLRVPAGHMEDFFEALANLHCSLERVIRRNRGEDAPEAYQHPGTREGADGIRFIAAAVESSKQDGQWTSL